MLDEGTPVLRLAPDVIVYDAEGYDDACYKYAVIHVLRVGGRDGWPEAPEEDEEDVEACEGVVGYAESAGDAPCAPLEGRLGDFVVIVESWMGDGL